MEAILILGFGLVVVLIVVFICVGMIKNFSGAIERRQESLFNMLSSQQDSIRNTISAGLSIQEERFKTFAVENEQKLDQIRKTVSSGLSDIRTDNNKKLDEMREIVDEKLQDSVSRSFRAVNERLEQVYKGLGEMQSLAAGVGDLKRVLTNVKTRGILGEIQLGAILEEIFAPEQYETNCRVKPDSREAVEYAVKIPSAEDDSFVYLPIDSKFPGDTYEKLLDAYDTGSKEAVDAAAKELIARIKAEAKDIRDKYIAPPYTTEFAVLFLPFEGLYCEAVNRGLVEELQRRYRVNIAGPSTMAAFLNSLQMGFRTVAIQKRSSEVWEVLGAVKTEFEKFDTVLESARNRIRQADDDLERLVGTRSNAIRRKLRSVTALSSDSAENLLGDSYEN
ncbi:MAG: DNA recombination protein RmuC [Clostridiales bacterium]|nr:DNA recombination protein RmuC [Clostridiales bacterium]